MKKKVLALFCVLLLLASPVQAQKWDLYKAYNGVYTNKSDGDGNEHAERDGGSDSGSEGTKVSAEDEATHDSQQDIRKGLWDIMKSIRNNNFNKIYDNGSTSTWGGKKRLTTSEIDNILSNLQKYQKNRKLGNGNLFNNNEYPRNLGSMTPPKMTATEKKKAQREIEKKENLKEKKGSKNSQKQSIKKSSKGKVNLNSAVTVVPSYIPPGAKTKNCVNDLVTGGIKDFSEWDNRYDTLKNYYETTRRHQEDTLSGIGTDKNIDAASFLEYLKMIHLYVLAHGTRFDYSWPRSDKLFSQAQKKVERGQKAYMVCGVPANWALKGIGADSMSTAYFGATRDRTGSLKAPSKTLSKYLKVLKHSKARGKTVKEAVDAGLLAPGDIISFQNREHTFVYSGMGYLVYDGGRFGNYVTKGILLDYNLIRAHASGRIGDIGRWKKLGNVTIIPPKDAKGKTFTGGSTVRIPGVSLEDVEDVAYIESYTLTKINRKYYNVTDYRSDKKRYRLYKSGSSDVMKEGELSGNKLTFDDVKEAGKYRLEWDQYATVTRGVSVGYLKRQYLVLLPSNTILYYNETFVDNDPVFIKKKTRDEWVYVGLQEQEILDPQTVKKNPTLIERVE